MAIHLDRQASLEQEKQLAAGRPLLHQGRAPPERADRGTGGDELAGQSTLQRRPGRDHLRRRFVVAPWHVPA
jgi:hypothetical protein